MVSHMLTMKENLPDIFETSRFDIDFEKELDMMAISTALHKQPMARITIDEYEQGGMSMIIPMDTFDYATDMFGAVPVHPPIISEEAPVAPTEGRFSLSMLEATQQQAKLKETSTSNKVEKTRVSL